MPQPDGSRCAGALRDPTAATISDYLDAMEMALANNSAEARRRAQFRNTMEALVAGAKQALANPPESGYVPPSVTCAYWPGCCCPTARCRRANA